MRSSFYSTQSKFGGSAVTAILDTFSVSNILELTDNHRNLLEKLRLRMREQVGEIRTSIDSLNQQLINDTFEVKEKQVDNPSTKELKAYAGKL